MAKADWAEGWKAQFIDRIGRDKRSFRSVSTDKDMPALSTIELELAKDAEFSGQYAHARDNRAEGIFEETLEIADNSTPESVQVDRLRIDTRKWMVGKMQPKKYGDKLDVTSGGEKLEAPQVITRTVIDPKAIDET